MNKSLNQHSTKQQLYGHLPPISKTIQGWWKGHAGYCWGSRDELISDVLLWILTYGRVSVGQPAKTYLYQACMDTGCSFEDLLEAMDDRDRESQGNPCYQRDLMMKLEKLFFLPSGCLENVYKSFSHQLTTYKNCSTEFSCRLSNLRFSIIRSQNKNDLLLNNLSRPFIVCLLLIHKQTMSFHC